MTHFNRIHEVNEVDLTAVVEPGVVTADFQAHVERLGLFYPPDPASREFCTLGGNAAENAGGVRAVKYGVTRDYILGLEAVLGSGEVVQTGVSTAKGVVGYDLTRLLVGSEGTLGVITKLILRLLPLPPAKETLAAYFSDMVQAGRTVAALTRARVIPAAMEFIDRPALDCVENYLRLGLDPRTRAMLLIETDGAVGQAKADAEVAMECCRQCGAFSVERAADRREAEKLWKARRALSPAMFQAAGGKANEDIVVPRSRIPEMLERIKALQDKHGLPFICFGHAGDGNIHVNIMYDPADPQAPVRVDQAAADLFRETLALGGTISGEHGVGLRKKPYIDLEIDRVGLAVMKRVKAALDPDGIMNPGKVFPDEGPAA
jgi:glycolate oxidase